MNEIKRVDMFQFRRNAVKPAATNKVLRFAVTRNWLFLARVSTFCGADVNHPHVVTGNTPLHICKSQKMCEFLLSKGANIRTLNLNNETSLQTLSGTNINLLWCAIANKDLELMKFLLEKGIDVNYPDPAIGRPPIWWAVVNDEIEMVKLLLENGANINNTEGQETLCWAAFYNATEVAKILLEKGADVNHMRTEGSYRNLTPLWLAIRQNNLDLAYFFIQNHANINYINNQGKTMLMSEAIKAKAPIVEFLLKNGAQVDLQQEVWKNTLENTHDLHCVALIKNAHEVRPMVPMLERIIQKKRLKNDLPIDLLPLDLIKEVKTMLTGHKVTAPKAALN